MRPTPQALALAALLTVSTTPFSLAQEPEETPAPAEIQDAPRHVLEEEIVVTATRSEEDPETVGSSVTVIGREEIERRHETSVLELLRTVPGLEVNQTGGPGTVGSVLLRGGGSEHTLVLIDGVRVNTTTTAAFDFGTLTADAVERIEVLRGPQSTLYGSEAMGGVVSIVTRRGEEGLELTGELVGGSHGHREARVTAGGGNRRWSGFVSLADLSTNGISAASERAGNTEDDGYDNTTLAGRLGLAVSDDGRLDLTVRRFDAETELDGFAFGVGPVDDLNFLQDRELTVASLAYEQAVSGRFRQRLSLGVADESLRGSDPDDLFNNFAIESTAAEATSLSDFAVTPDDVLTVGLSVERREASNVGAFDESSTLRSAFVQQRFRVRDRLHLAVGARHDDDSIAGGETTYRVAGAYVVPATGTRLHGSVGTGFRAPTFNERFFPGAGNPALSPETSRGVDFGIEHRFGNGRAVADLTAFDQRYDDLVVFDLTSFSFANVAEAASRGVESSLRLTATDRLELAASYTWNDTEDEATGLQLARRPEHRATALVIFEPTTRLRGTASLVAARERIDSDGLPLEDYERVDLSLDYRWGEHLRPYVRLDNLLDEDYEEIRGFTTPGRTVLVGVKASL
jgi:vitamin B12 transporter